MLLYHYTSLQTLCSIINGMQNGHLFLRATNAQNMNDPNDCYYFIDVINQIIDNIDIDEIVKQKNKYDTPYLICLSKRKDDLHMWNCYGDNGNGVAIGFDLGKLNEKVNEFFQKNHTSAKLFKCLYASPKQVKNSLDFASLFIKTKINKSFWQNEQISNISNIIKHPCYRYEREFRIVIKHGKEEKVITDAYNKDEDAFYLPLPINAVKSIIVGPNANFDAIKKIFEDYFPYAKFLESVIPYRSK